MAYELHVIVGGRELGKYQLEPDVEYVVGRDSSTDIIVPDRSVSRRHCTAKVVAGGVEFQDLKSANGLYVDGRLLTTAVLRGGGKLNLGMAQITVASTQNQTGLIELDPALLDEFAHDFESSSGMSFDMSDPSEISSAILEQAKTRTRTDSDVSMTSISTQAPEYKDLEKDKLAVLIETAKSLGQSTDVDQLLERVMEHMFELMPVQRGVVAITEDGGETFVPRVVHPAADAPQLSAVASQSIMQDVARAGQAKIVDDAQVDERLNMNQSIVMHNIRAAVCAPLVANGVCLGAIYADFPGRASIYGNSDRDFITAFANIAAVSLQNAQMTKKLRSDDRMKRDLEIAAEIQQGILPEGSFAVGLDGVEFDWAYAPSKQVGGDFYDLFTLGDGRIGIAIGDVSGKSVGAALYMARTMSFMRAVVGESQSAGEILTRVNRLLGSGGERVLFATTFFMIVDPRSGVVEWSNAGHNPALVHDVGDGSWTTLDAVGPPIGVAEDFEYDNQELTVRPNTLITLYTDGLVEARNVEGVELGLPRVKALVQETSGDPVPDITRVLLDEVKKHIVDAPYRLDDIAILNMRVLGDSTPDPSQAEEE